MESPCDSQNRFRRTAGTLHQDATIDCTEAKFGMTGQARLTGTVLSMERVSPEARSPRLRRLCVQTHTQRAGDLQDGCEARVSVFTESLVEALSTEAGVARDLRHSLGASDIT